MLVKVVGSVKTETINISDIKNGLTARLKNYLNGTAIAFEGFTVGNYIQLAQLANFNPDWDRLEAATDSLREHMAKLSAAEKRIAELESNEIREDGNQFLVVRHPGKTPVIKHCSGDLEEFLRNLIEQDPLVTIDIITHRYYGVGGQWVQDADEYLHMMAAAGIGVKGE